MYVTPYKSYDLFNQYILKPTKLTIRCKQRKSSLNVLIIIIKDIYIAQPLYQYTLLRITIPTLYIHV